MRATPGKLVERMLSGKMGVFEAGDEGGDPFAEARAAFASAMAEATGTFVSKRQPAGTHPCLLVSGSRIPFPVGSR